MVKNKFIRQALNNKKKGALHRQLGYGEDEVIPEGYLVGIKASSIGGHVYINGKRHTVTRLLKKRAVFALNIRR